LNKSLSLDGSTINRPFALALKLLRFLHRFLIRAVPSLVALCTVDADAVSDVLGFFSLARSAGQTGGITAPSVPVIEQMLR
jgi:hypothetical protein